MRNLMEKIARPLAMSLLAGLLVAVPPMSRSVQADTARAEAAALMSSGADSIEHGRFDEAAVAFSNALDSGGLTPEGRALAYHHRGVALQKVGRQDAAIADYTRAIDTNALPANVLARAHYNRGIAYGMSAKPREAEQDYLKTVELVPDYAAAHHNLANLERRRGAYDEAIAHYSAAIENMSGKARKLPLFGRALAREQTGDLEGTAADLRQAVALDPEFDLAASKLSAIAPQLATMTAKNPQIVPATLAPFQAASSGHEGGEIIRISSIGGWRTTATRFTAASPAPAAVAGQAENDALTTSSLRPADDIPGKASGQQLSSEGAADVAPGRYKLQLGAFRQQEVAARAWDEISSSADPLVGQSGHTIQKADLGERGIFYRLRAGGFERIDDARSACKALERRKIACFVVDG
ncbi:MAG: SPOR domain-containing protein [Parvibaculum sp.]|nr:SPOR domain-containing protein [Parvibaculum sp.]